MEKQNHHENCIKYLMNCFFDLPNIWVKGRKSVRSVGRHLFPDDVEVAASGQIPRVYPIRVLRKVSG